MKKIWEILHYGDDYSDIWYNADTGIGTDLIIDAAFFGVCDGHRYGLWTDECRTQQSAELYWNSLCRRGVPLIVLAYFIYFGVPAGIQGIGFKDFRLNALQAGTIALSMNCGAYMAEIIRAGIQSVDRGQMEAGRSLGLSYSATMALVVIPQAIRTMIPSIINQFIITLKDTSILSVIGFPELTNVGKTIMGNTFKNLQTWAIIGIMYMIVIVTLSKISKKLERRINRGR